MILVESRNLKIRLLESKDALQISRWLSDPRVLEYYEGRDSPHDLELVRKHYYEEKGENTSCIIQYKYKDIGYVQYYLLDKEDWKDYGYLYNPGKIYGMDQFIGEPDYWNKGIGTELVQTMTAYLVNEKQAHRIVMDPQAWNHRAIKIYEKCGFKKKKLLPKHEWHEGEYRDCWLMEYVADK